MFSSFFYSFKKSYLVDPIQHSATEVVINCRLEYHTAADTSTTANAKDIPLYHNSGIGFYPKSAINFHFERNTLRRRLPLPHADAPQPPTLMTTRVIPRTTSLISLSPVMKSFTATNGISSGSRSAPFRLPVFGGECTAVGAECTSWRVYTAGWELRHGRLRSSPWAPLVAMATARSVLTPWSSSAAACPPEFRHSGDGRVGSPDLIWERTAQNGGISVVCELLPHRDALPPTGLDLMLNFCRHVRKTSAECVSSKLLTFRARDVVDTMGKMWLYGVIHFVVSKV